MSCANNYFRTGDAHRAVQVRTFDDHSLIETELAFEAIKRLHPARIIAWRPPKCAGPWDGAVGYVGRGPVKTAEDMDDGEE